MVYYTVRYSMIFDSAVTESCDSSDYMIGQYTFHDVYG